MRMIASQVRWLTTPSVFRGLPSRESGWLFDLRFVSLTFRGLIAINVVSKNRL